MPRVLVVDDDSVSRQILRHILESAGYTVEERSDSDAGIEAHLTQSFDLVVTDIFMPDRGGLDVIGRIKARDPEAPVIAVSGAAIGGALDIFRLARQLGASHTLTKPVSPEQLLEAVSEALAG